MITQRIIINSISKIVEKIVEGISIINNKESSDVLLFKPIHKKDQYLIIIIN